MKKITLFILTIFTSATLFAAARPSLDGRAVVAESGTMPRGLFARTVGYLPGDSVTVTNPSAGTSVDVLILGAIDPSEGVAILLSPESADALKIRPNANVQVKLTKRAGSLDENALGTAIIAEEGFEEISFGDDAEETPEADVEVAPETVEETPSAAEEEPQNPEVAETTAEPEPEVPAAENPVEIVEEEELQKVILVPAEKETETAVESLPPENTEDSEVVKEEIVESDMISEKVEEEAPEIPSESEKIEEDIVPPAEPEQPESESEEEVVEVSVEVKTDDETVEVNVEIAEPPAETEETDAVPETESEETVEIVEDVDGYQPIILVPAEANPPIVEEVAKPVIQEEVIEEKAEAKVSVPEVVEETPVQKKVVVETVIVEKPAPVPAPKPEPVVEKVAKPVSFEDLIAEYLVPSFKDLKSGFYYIQFASLGSESNIRSALEKYGKKYPIVIVPNASGKVYQLLVGPLNIDEYGSLLEKFKSFGHKDAFVRKIK